jgi:hypothetical protein
MKISDLLHKVADEIAEQGDQEITLQDNVEDDDAEKITDAMVPPLQQELELKKKRFGVTNAFDRGQVHEEVDELEVIKKLTGLQK